MPTNFFQDISVPELIEKILSDLTIRELCLKRPVSSKWKAIIDNYFRIFLDPFKAEFGLSNQSAAITQEYLINTFGDSYRSITLCKEYCQNHDLNEFQTALLPTIIKLPDVEFVPQAPSVIVIGDEDAFKSACVRNYLKGRPWINTYEHKNALFQLMTKAHFNFGDAITKIEGLNLQQVSLIASLVCADIDVRDIDLHRYPWINTYEHRNALFQLMTKAHFDFGDVITKIEGLNLQQVSLIASLVCADIDVRDIDLHRYPWINTYEHRNALFQLMTKAHFDFGDVITKIEGLNLQQVSLIVSLVCADIDVRDIDLHRYPWINTQEHRNALVWLMTKAHFNFGDAVAKIDGLNLTQVSLIASLVCADIDVRDIDLHRYPWINTQEHENALVWLMTKAHFNFGDVITKIEGLNLQQVSLIASLVCADIDVRDIDLHRYPWINTQEHENALVQLMTKAHFNFGDAVAKIDGLNLTQVSLIASLVYDGIDVSGIDLHRYPWINTYEHKNALFQLMTKAHFNFGDAITKIEGLNLQQVSLIASLVYNGIDVSGIDLHRYPWINTQEHRNALVWLMTKAHFNFGDAVAKIEGLNLTQVSLIASLVYNGIDVSGIDLHRYPWINTQEHRNALVGLMTKAHFNFGDAVAKIDGLNLTQVSLIASLVYDGIDVSGIDLHRYPWINTQEHKQALVGLMTKANFGDAVAKIEGLNLQQVSLIASLVYDGIDVSGIDLHRYPWINTREHRIALIDLMTKAHFNFHDAIAKIERELPLSELQASLKQECKTVGQETPAELAAEARGQMMSTNIMPNSASTSACKSGCVIV